MPPVRVTRKAGPVSVPFSSLRWRSNQARVRSSSRSSSDGPPSWPPAIHSTATGAPLERIAFAMASAWPSGKRESERPWTISAGTSIRSATATGLRSRSSSRASWSGSPATATRSYISHSSVVNRPQPARSETGPAVGAPSPATVEPVVKKIPVHSSLKTPSGKRACDRSQ